MYKNFVPVLLVLLFVVIYFVTQAENYSAAQPMVSPNSDMKISNDGVEFNSGWSVVYPPPKPEIKIIRPKRDKPAKPPGPDPIRLSIVKKPKKPTAKPIEQELASGEYPFQSTQEEELSEYPFQPLEEEEEIETPPPTFEDYKLLKGDCPGGDLEPRIGFKIEDCKKVCDTDPSCRGFTYDNQTQTCTPKKTTCVPAVDDVGLGRDTLFYQKRGKPADRDYTWAKGVCRPSSQRSSYLPPKYHQWLAGQGRLTTKRCKEACDGNKECIGFDIFNMDDKNVGDCVLHKYGPIKPYNDLVVSDSYCSPNGHRCRCYVHSKRRGYERQRGVCRPASAYRGFFNAKTHSVKYAGKHAPRACARICAATPNCGAFEYVNTPTGQSGHCLMHMYPDARGYRDSGIDYHYCRPNGQGCSCYVMAKE